MLNLGLIATIVALLGLGALFGASLYDAVVLAPNLRGGPAGLEHGRLFMAAATPANLFRILAPATQLLLLLAVVTNWTNPQRRWPLIGALLALVLSDVITFTYHYPRNRLLFTAPLTIDPDRLSLAARQWAAANLLRVVLVLGAWVGTLIALTRSSWNGMRGRQTNPLPQMRDEDDWSSVCDDQAALPGLPSSCVLA